MTDQVMTEELMARLCAEGHEETDIAGVWMIRARPRSKKIPKRKTVDRYFFFANNKMMGAWLTKAEAVAQLQYFLVMHELF